MASTKAAPRAALEDGALEKFEVQRIHRKDLIKAEYNPRVLSDDARRKLKENLQKVGLLSPLVWNKRSGNVVSGHQRLSQMDALMGTNDYHLTVSVVDLDDVTEREQNLFFNNQFAMGDWDFTKLESLFKTEGMAISRTGFDAADVKDLFGTASLMPDDLMKLSDQVHDAHKLAESAASSNDLVEQKNFYTVLVFKSNDVAARFNEYLGVPDSRYVDGLGVMRAINEKVSDNEHIPDPLMSDAQS